MIAAPDHIPDYRRIKILYAVILASLALIVIRLWYLQIVKGPELSEQSDLRRTRTLRRAAARGAIVDSAGRPLATSRFRFVVSLAPDEIRRNPDVLGRIAALLSIPADEIRDDISRSSRLYDTVPIATDVDLPVLSKIKEQQLDLQGVYVTRDPERFYVDEQLCTHLLGRAAPIDRTELRTLKGSYRGGDVVGKDGLEKMYEADLRGKDGGQVVSVSAHGRVLGTVQEVKPVPGKTLRLTIDRGLQRTAYTALREELCRAGHPGSVVAVDPNDGSVLAMVSCPSYDLNKFKQDYGRLRTDRKLTPLVNRAVNSGYPCGSTFKLVTAAAGLECGAITAGSSIYCPGSLKLGRHIFHCDKRSGHGSLGLEDAIGQSCDVYFWRVAQEVGIDRLAAAARSFGLGQSTGIDLPPSRSARGLVPSPEWKKKYRREIWYPGDLLLTAIGQGYVKVTPLQLADYTAALANGGTLWAPQLVREVVDVSGSRPAVVRRVAPESRGRLPLSAEHRDAIVAGMQRVVQKRGTAAACAIPGFDYAAKTGTAQVSNKNDNSVFVCFAPLVHPRIAIAVLVENGGHGSDVAAPIARRMLNEFFRLKLNDASVPVGRSLGVD